MSFRLQWKPCFRYEIVPAEGVVLLSEYGYVLLPGLPYLQLAPLLEGQHTDLDIVERLRGQLSAAEVFYTLHLLQRQGYVVNAIPPILSEQAVFWGLLNVDPEEAIKRLQETTVSVLSLGNVSPIPFYEALTALGIQTGNDSQYCVVITDDHLREELEDFNRQALLCDRSWLLLKPVGVEVWVGPLFVPGKTGCWECLAHRLRGARKIESYLQRKNNFRAVFSPPLIALASTIQTAYNIAATQTAKWIAARENLAIEGRIITSDVVSLTSRSHQLVQRPQCPACGDPTAFAAKRAEPLLLQSRKKLVVFDGVSFGLSPEETVKKLEHHISPITGIVSALESNTPQNGKVSLTPSYIAAHNFVHVSRESITDWDFLLASVRSASGGKGKLPVHAKASALCEALERYSGVFQGDEARFRAKLKDLGAAAIHPNACMLFSEWQFANREQWNAHGSWCNWVPEPFDETREIDWSPAWSLTYGEPHYLPTAYCYYGYSRKYNAWFTRADSNGCAAGFSKEEAILQGFLELVERDSVALWWYNRLSKPAVDLASFVDPYFQELQQYYQTLHRDLWVLDLTSDLNIPTFAAISRRNDRKTEDIIFGFGSHFDAHVAILRSLTEMNQSLPAVFSVRSDEDDSYLDRDSWALSWWRTATLANQRYLAPNPALPPKVQESYPECWSDDFADDVRSCVRIAQEKGLETMVLDQTRPDTGLYVVKVIVPGLRHFWARFAPGRLYQVPVQMGCLTEPLTEEQLNPQHIYF